VILMAYLFGWLAGAGLPPTATYIIGAIVIVQPLQQLGINPWIAHFFVFLLSVWGELSPPTSLTAAVSARIAEASFMRTMWEALKICAPITLMTFAIFTRSDMVVNPGWPQVAATLLVFVGTSGIAFAFFGRFVENLAADLPLRLLMALGSFVVLFFPDGESGERIISSVVGVQVPPAAVPIGASLVVAAALALGISRHRQMPQTLRPQQVQESALAAGGDQRLIAEAKREV